MQVQCTHILDLFRLEDKLSPPEVVKLDVVVVKQALPPCDLPHLRHDLQDQLDDQEIVFDGVHLQEDGVLGVL